MPIEEQHGRFIPAGQRMAVILRAALKVIRQQTIDAVRTGHVIPPVTPAYFDLIRSLTPEVEKHIRKGAEISRTDRRAALRSRPSPPIRVTPRIPMRFAPAVITPPTGGIPQLDPVLGIDLSGAFTLFLPTVKPAAERMVTNFIQEMAQTTQDAVRKAIAEGLEKGEALSQIQARLLGIREMSTIAGRVADLPVFSPKRAYLVAATEASRAMHLGQYEYGRSIGAAGVEWHASKDSCFVAGSQVIKVADDGHLVSVGIETLTFGDRVIGKSGRVCRVLGTARKWHVGDIINGPGFSATADHQFFGNKGWLPIREYLGHTGVGVGDKSFSTNPDDSPPTLFQVLGLPSILGRDFGFVVPKFPVGKDDQTPIVDDEINNPFVVHRNLLTEMNSFTAKKTGHNYFDVRSLRSICDSVERWIFRTLHRFRMMLVGTFSRAERFVLGLPSVPNRHELFLALVARPASFRRDVRKSLKTPTQANSSAKLGVPLIHTARRNPFFFPTNTALNKRLAEMPMLEFAGALNAAKSLAPIDFPRRNEKLFFASAANDFDSRFNPVNSVALHPTSFRPDVGSPKFFFADGTRLIHAEIVQRQLTKTSGFFGYVYDIQVEDDESFVLACGLIAHNCKICLPLNGQRRRYGEPFITYSDKVPPEYRYVYFPPAHPNCRCAVSDWFDE